MVYWSGQSTVTSGVQSLHTMKPQNLSDCQIHLYIIFLLNNVGDFHHPCRLECIRMSLFVENVFGFVVHLPT